MKAPRYEPRSASAKPVGGIVPGSTCHLILLALRGVGGMTSDQAYARFNGGTSAALHRLKGLDLIALPENGAKGKPITLTTKGRAVTDPDGPLNRRATLITYCQL